MFSPYAVLCIYGQNPFIVKLLTAVLIQELGKYSMSTSVDINCYTREKLSKFGPFFYCSSCLANGI